MNWFSIYNKIRCRSKKKLLAKRGMTMAELLIVVAIIVVLAGVAFIAVNNHQRSMAQLERDGIAKEIFVAAQNHLTAAQGQGYLGKTGFGTEGNYAETKELEIVKDEDKHIYYFVVTNGIASDAAADIFNLMLPFGSIDETVRGGGSYLIRYQPDTGTILDVFYCSTSGSPSKYNHQLQIGEYETVMDLRSDKFGRRNYTDGSVLGYYGGVDSETIATLQLKAPKIDVVNDDKLKVIITDDPSNSEKYPENEKYSLKLIITGELSHAQKSYVLLKSAGSSESLETDRLEADSKYTIILDDITTEGKHFFEIKGETKKADGTTIAFIPGENISVQAVAYSIKEFSNIAYSTIKTTNSLFGDGTTSTTAQIGSIRHLENLDKRVSNLDNNDRDDLLKIGTAVQYEIKDEKKLDWMDWDSFCGGSVGIYGHNDVGSSVQLTSSGFYYPIEPDYSLTYDGKGLSISNIQVNSNEIKNSYARDNAGLFGSVSASTVSSISNLELIDFSVTGNTSAGALAGSLTGCIVTNVLARNTNASFSGKISATGNAGGLIGVTDEHSPVSYSAAAVIVKGSTAGGLIGTANGAVTASFSGGHTKDGSYDEWIKDKGYDVEGTTVAGGLVGNATAAITNSYSTCSVKGTTSGAGGFVGTTSASGQIDNCYCTGRVVPDYPDPEDKSVRSSNAFCSGGLLGGGSDNRYYSIINEVLDEKDTIVYKAPGSDAVSPLDADAGSYDQFVGAMTTWDSVGVVYDTPLIKYYDGKYPLRTVLQLLVPDTGTKTKSSSDYFVSKHYGDWPAPEIFIINSK